MSGNSFDSPIRISSQSTDKEMETPPEVIDLVTPEKPASAVEILRAKRCSFFEEDQMKTATKKIKTEKEVPVKKEKFLCEKHDLTEFVSKKDHSFGKVFFKCKNKPCAYFRWKENM